MLARATADASRLINVGEALDQMNRLDGALLHTSRALDLIRRADAKVLFPDRMPHVGVALLLLRELAQGDRRTRLAARRAGDTAVSVAEVHLGLSEGRELHRRLQTLLWATRDAEPARHTRPREDLTDNRARRQHGRRTFRHARKRNRRIATVCRLLDGADGRQHAHALQGLAPRQIVGLCARVG